MSGTDARVCRNTRVRLRGRLEAYGVGGSMATGRWEGVFVGRGGGGSAMRGGRVLWCVVVTPCLCGAQVGDGGSSSRFTPVAVSGLSSGVVMVAAGSVRARVVCCGYLWVLGM